MYRGEGSESTRKREWVQRDVAGTSPGSALQGDSSRFSGQLLSPALGFGGLCISGCTEMGREAIKC